MHVLQLHQLYDSRKEPAAAVHLGMKNFTPGWGGWNSRLEPLKTKPFVLSGLQAEFLWTKSLIRSLSLFNETTSRLLSASRKSNKNLQKKQIWAAEMTLELLFRDVRL